MGKSRLPTPTKTSSRPDNAKRSHRLSLSSCSSTGSVTGQPSPGPSQDSSRPSKNQRVHESMDTDGTVPQATSATNVDSDSSSASPTVVTSSAGPPSVVTAGVSGHSAVPPIVVTAGAVGHSTSPSSVVTAVDTVVTAAAAGPTAIPPSDDASGSSTTSPSPSTCDATDDGFTVVGKKNTGNGSHPATRTSPLSRPSVSVAPPPRLESQFPAFRVPAQEGFPCSYDAVAALENGEPHLNTKNTIGRDGSSILLPLDAQSFHTLEAIANDPGAEITVNMIDRSLQVTKGVIMGFPLRLPLAIILRHPQVEDAVRCQTAATKEDTRQVIVSLRGPLVPSLTFGNWGTFYIRPFNPEPLRCFRCQKFGHHQATCTRQATCGVCSGQHETQGCLDRYKAKEAVRHHCPNCGGSHHAWNKACPVRLAQVTRGRERQVAWVETQQKTSASPAPPGTFVWGQQRRPQVAPPLPTATQFPPLPAVATSTARTSVVSPPPTASTLPPAPSDAQSEAVFTLSDLREFGKNLATGVAKCLVRILKAKVEPTSLEQAMNNVVEEVLAKTMDSKSKTERRPSSADQRKSRKPSSSLPRLSTTTPAPSAAGLTPATAGIEAEKKALGIETALSRHNPCPAQAGLQHCPAPLTTLAVSDYVNGTAGGSGQTMQH